MAQTEPILKLETHVKALDELYPEKGTFLSLVTLLKQDLDLTPDAFSYGCDSETDIALCLRQELIDLVETSQYVLCFTVLAC